MGGEGTRSLPAAVVSLGAAVEAFRQAGACGDAEVLTTLLRLSSTVDALVLREVAAVEASRAATSAGFGSTAELVRDATGAAVRDASATVRVAQRLAGDLAPLGEQLMAGQITRRHVDAVVHGLRGLDAWQVEQVLPAVCEAATVLDPVVLTTVLREHAEAVSPQLAEEFRRRLDARVGVSLSEGPDGAGLLRGLLSAEARAALAAVLDATMGGEREAGDDRTATRRRHDALLELAQHVLDCPDADLPAQGGARAQVAVVAAAGAVADVWGCAPARLVGSCHGLLTRDELLRLLCDADVSTAHLGIQDGRLEVLDLGRDRRTVSRGQWRALMVRDRTCVVQGCSRPPSSCQGHHVRHWADGGGTDLGNLVLLCHSHHRQVHDRQVVLAHRDGRAFGPAGWTDPRHLPWRRLRRRATGVGSPRDQ